MCMRNVCMCVYMCVCVCVGVCVCVCVCVLLTIDSPVHEAVLHLEVIDDKRVSEVHVGYGLVQGEPLGVEGYEAVALGPLLDGFV